MADEEVIRRVVHGEVWLFEIIMRRYNQRLYRAARAILKDEMEAEDAIQEAYLNAYAHLAQFARRASFATWLTSIAINEARKRAARRVRFETLFESKESELEEKSRPKRSADAEQEASVRQLIGVLERAMGELPEHLRTVFTLRDVEQMSQAESAQLLGIRELTVKTRLHRARRLLRKLLSAHFGEVASHVFEFGNSRCDSVVAAVMERLSQESN